MIRRTGPPPGERADWQERVQKILDFWNALSIDGDSGETTWGDLEPSQTEVTDCLAREPKDTARAESLTAYALMLITGQIDF
jgi:hypothetical protein